MGEQIVELSRALADQMREDFALLLALEIGAGRRCGQIELRRVAGMLGHSSNRYFDGAWRFPHSIARRRALVKAR